MQLVSFSVSNFRSITTAYKLPIKQATILIGPNNEGKSNILRALVLALEVLSSLGGRRITGNRLRAVYLDTRGQYNWLSDFPVSLQDKMPDGESIFDLEFKLTDPEIEEFYEEVKSTLDGKLPIRLTLGPKAPGFYIRKKGPGALALSKKAEAIANFVAKRININYIPAVRTAGCIEHVNRTINFCVFTDSPAEGLFGLLYFQSRLANAIDRASHCSRVLAERLTFPNRTPLALSSASWVFEAIELAQKGKQDESLDLIFDSIDGLLLKGSFVECDNVLSELPIREMSNAQLLTTLTATLPAKEKLRNRSLFFRQVCEALKGRNADADVLLRGLD